MSFESCYEVGFGHTGSGDFFNFWSYHFYCWMLSEIQ